MKRLVVLLLFLQTIFHTNASLEVTQDEELVNLIRSEKYVVVLFSKPHCELCDKYETELTSLREDLVETLNAWVVKVVNSQLSRLYSPDPEPVLVFFRHGVPLLYSGPLNDEYILHTFTANKEPLTKELTDETFEHLTQAASGSTTGDWFVMFYSADCVDCQRLQARWEAVGAQIKSRVNIARVNRATTGAKTARRFNVFQVPEFILFRGGKMYRYHNHAYDVPSFVSFAQDWYKNAKAETVPVPKSPFDDLVALIVVYLKENPWLWQLGFGTFVLGLVISFIMKLLQRNSTGTKKKPTSQKKKSKDK